MVTTHPEDAVGDLKDAKINCATTALVGRYHHGTTEGYTICERDVLENRRYV